MEDLLCNTGNSTQRLRVPYSGRGRKKTCVCVCVCVYIVESLCYTPETNHIVNRPYANKIKITKILMHSKLHLLSSSLTPWLQDLTLPFLSSSYGPWIIQGKNLGAILGSSFFCILACSQVVSSRNSSVSACITHQSISLTDLCSLSHLDNCRIPNILSLESQVSIIHPSMYIYPWVFFPLC